MTARRKNNIANYDNNPVLDHENNVVLLSNIDSWWLFPGDTSARGNADVDIEEVDPDVSLINNLQKMLLTILDDVSNKTDSDKIGHVANLMSISCAMADREHIIDELQLSDVQMPHVKTKGRPSSNKITSDKTITDKAYADCLKRDAQAKRKTLTQIKSNASTSASVKKPCHCSMCKQPGHDTRRCPNQNNNLA
ncbi:hypothetical protein H4S08_004761 [Coemansia sp. RSA 1365]|nr:hypothetical protein H4S08_004761 [Coemansia sp. RSA 1365]